MHEPQRIFPSPLLKGEKLATSQFSAEVAKVIEGPFFTLIRSLTPPLGANFLCQYVFMLPQGQKVEKLKGEPEVFFPIPCFCHISPLIFSIKWDLLAPKEQINPYWSRKENPSFLSFL